MLWFEVRLLRRLLVSTCLRKSFNLFCLIFVHSFKQKKRAELQPAFKMVYPLLFGIINISKTFVIIVTPFGIIKCSFEQLCRFVRERFH